MIVGVRDLCTCARRHAGKQPQPATRALLESRIEQVETLPLGWILPKATKFYSTNKGQTIVIDQEQIRLCVEGKILHFPPATEGIPSDGKINMGRNGRFRSIDKSGRTYPVREDGSRSFPNSKRPLGIYWEEWMRIPEGVREVLLKEIDKLNREFEPT
jgi:hypothetical protein